MKLYKKLIQKIFSIKNIPTHKIITICGLKIKISRRSDIDFRELKNYLSNEIFAANLIKEMHSRTFPRYKNCHKNEEIVITATGPTLNYYKPIHKAIHIGVNRAYKAQNINKLDYIFICDFWSVKEEEVDEIANYTATVFLGTYSSINKSEREHSIPVKYRNYPNTNCYAIDYPRNLRYPDIEICGLMDYGSVVFNAAHFASYTHPKKIYLVGCDCSQNGYFDNTKQSQPLRVNAIIEGWKKFKEYMDWYYPDTEIISINPVGLKGVFKDIYTQSYIDANPELNNNPIEILDQGEELCKNL